MTLIEIMIVVLIMALIATGVSFAVLPRLKKAKINTTKSRLATVRGAVEMYLAENDDCPTIEVLVSERYISKKPEDAWGRPFIIECEEGGEEVRVISIGPDGAQGTEDDISE
jgi:general secretion pathway protein G